MKIPINSLSLTPVISILYKLWIRSLLLEDQGDWKRLLHQHGAGQAFVLCLWHEELFAVTGYGYTKTRDLVTCVSQSNDGELITNVLHTLGHATVRGSSSRGGVGVLRKLKRIMERENRVAVFTIDGPRGPRRIPKAGPIFLAQRTGAKLVPIRAFPRHKYVFEKSWDHFQIPYPFRRCPIRIGTPYNVTTQKLTEDVMAREIERLRQAMEGLVPE